MFSWQIVSSQCIKNNFLLAVGVSELIKMFKCFPRFNLLWLSWFESVRFNLYCRSDILTACFKLYDCFPETGKGYISLRDLQRLVFTHDFNWTETEIATMIHSFDSDRDGKVSLYTILLVQLYRFTHLLWEFFFWDWRR